MSSVYHVGVTKATLYRAFDRSDQLLYIGHTIRPHRLVEHCATARWWPETVCVRLEHFSTTALAKAAEEIAVRDERPLFNIVQPRDWDVRWQKIERLRISGMKWREVAEAVDMQPERLGRLVARRRKRGTSRV